MQRGPRSENESFDVLRRIDSLERSLGPRVLERFPEGYALTAAGEQLRDGLSGVRDQIESAQRRLAGLDTELTGTIRSLVCFFALAQHAFGAHLRPFFLRLPCVSAPLELPVAVPIFATERVGSRADYLKFI